MKLYKLNLKVKLYYTYNGRRFSCMAPDKSPNCNISFICRLQSKYKKMDTLNVIFIINKYR